MAEATWRSNGTRWRNTAPNRGKGKAPSWGRESSAKPPLPLEGANVNEKDLGGSWLKALPPLGPHRALGRPLGSGGAQVTRRCTTPPTTATASWSKCCLLQVLGASTASTPNTTTLPEHRWGLNVLPSRCYRTLPPEAPPDATSWLPSSSSDGLGPEFKESPRCGPHHQGD